MENIKIYSQPVNALRYIILDNFETNEYAWSFANRHTSHSTLEEEYRSVHGRSWCACSGGFYCYRGSNAVDSNINELDKLELFGKSDSFGLKEHVYTEAIKVLNLYDKSAIIDDSWILDYFERQKNHPLRLKYGF